MRRYERCACGRWKATDRQSEKWSNWCYNSTPNWRYALYKNNPEPFQVKLWRIVRSRVATPIWWRLATRCMGWYDCISRDESADQWSDYPWHVRFMFHLEPLKEVVSDANTQS